MPLWLSKSAVELCLWVPWKLLLSSKFHWTPNYLVSVRRKPSINCPPPPSHQWAGSGWISRRKSFVNRPKSLKNEFPEGTYKLFEVVPGKFGVSCKHIFTSNLTFSQAQPQRICANDRKWSQINHHIYSLKAPSLQSLMDSDRASNDSQYTDYNIQLDLEEVRTLSIVIVHHNHLYTPLSLSP